MNVNPANSRIVLVLFLCVSWYILLPGQKTVAGTFTHKGLTRKYRLFLPTGYAEGKPMPLVFNFHGFTSNAAQQEILSDMNTIADTAHFLVCYPEGINASWNVGWAFGSTADDVGFTSAMIDELASLYHVDKARVFACGMSNGGFMSYRLACQLSDRIAAIASVTGSIVPASLSSCKPGRPVPVMEIHGTADNVVGYNGTPAISAPIPDVLRLWQKNNGCDEVPDKYPVPDSNPGDGTTTEQWRYRNCQPKGDLIHYRVTNGGHAWPGASLSLPGTSLDFSATKVIWQFFSQQVLATPSGAEEIQKDINPLLVSPNPAREIVTLQFDSPGVYQLFIYSQTGNILLQQRFESASAEIDVSTLNSGMYIFHVYDNTRSASLKFVKL